MRVFVEADVVVCTEGTTGRGVMACRSCSTGVGDQGTRASGPPGTREVFPPPHAMTRRAGPAANADQARSGKSAPLPGANERSA